MLISFKGNNSLLKRVTLFVLILSSVGWLGYRVSDHYFEIAKNLDVFGRILREINSNYVDDVEFNQLTKSGIDAMLKTLDPYTNFITASEIEDYRFMSTGQYGGIGARVEINKGKIYVAEIYKDAPAHKAGVKVGDEIIQIDNENLSGRTYTMKEIRNLLYGQPKTTAKLKVKRLNDPQPKLITVEREDIKVKNVPFYTLIQNEYAYIVLENFTKDASTEIKKAFEELKTQNANLKGLILDLRENPGGLLFEAINISNLFVARGEKIVETKGKMEGSTKSFEAMNDPLDMNIPLAILINQRSASASEIVAGVIQDLDRGVIVGRRSFGKGLVQTTRNLSYNYQLKITTSKYFTPSGRCIQAIDYSNRASDGSVSKTPDSLKREFRTRKGRPVKDAGGIEPDVWVEEPEMHKVTQDLKNQLFIFNYATHYCQKNPTMASAYDFKITDEIWQDFLKFIEAQGFKVESKYKSAIDDLRKQLTKELYYDKVATSLTALEQQINTQVNGDVQTYKNEITNLLQTEIVSRYYFQEGVYITRFRNDPDIVEAIKVLQDKQRYQKILQSSK